MIRKFIAYIKKLFSDACCEANKEINAYAVYPASVVKPSNPGFYDPFAEHILDLLSQYCTTHYSCDTCPFFNKKEELCRRKLR